MARRKAANQSARERYFPYFVKVDLSLYFCLINTKPSFYYKLKLDITNTDWIISVMKTSNVSFNTGFLAADILQFLIVDRFRSKLNYTNCNYKKLGKFYGVLKLTSSFNEWRNSNVVCPVSFKGGGKTEKEDFPYLGRQLYF